MIGRASKTDFSFWFLNMNLKVVVEDESRRGRIAFLPIFCNTVREWATFLHAECGVGGKGNGGFSRALPVNQQRCVCAVTSRGARISQGGGCNKIAPTGGGVDSKKAHA